MFDENALFEISEFIKIEQDETRAAHRAASKANGSHRAPAEQYREVDSKVNLLFRLIRDLKALANRACEAAVRESARATKAEETAAAELTGLRLQLKERSEALDARDRALREHETISHEKIGRLEAAVREKEEQIEGCHNRARALLAEIDSLQARLNEVAGGMRQAEARFRELAEQQQARINFLNEELEIKEGLLQAKEEAMRQLVEESRGAISSLEERLQAVDAVLEIKDAELREQQAALQANAANEKILAQLMQDLTVQSQALMAELSETNDLISELENRSHMELENGLKMMGNELQEPLR
jgi:chromosome segregation ATPase